MPTTPMKFSLSKPPKPRGGAFGGRRTLRQCAVARAVRIRRAMTPIIHAVVRKQRSEQRQAPRTSRETRRYHECCGSEAHRGVIHYTRNKSK